MTDKTIFMPAALADAWLPLETIPRDGNKVELLSPTEGVDIGHWYFFDPKMSPPFPEWTPEIGDDWTGGISTGKGSGDYTHWRPISDAIESSMERVS